ncbi:MAG: sigma-70 family RNA polymerase sigma factor [Rubrobacter sp.]|nr:sigma-70 family RNA polymerase sigma factor [Rubrobacter sp.]
MKTQSTCEARQDRRSPKQDGARRVILVGVRPQVEPHHFGGDSGGFGLEGATDEVLIQRVAESDDRRAFSELYDRYGNLVYNAGMRHLRDRTLAEDLVQDVFVSVWRNAASFDPSKAGFSTWVYRIARNRATDLGRRRSARARTVSPPQGEDALPEPDEVDEILRTFDVMGALSEVSEAHREVLALAYFGGLSQREISRRTGIPLGTVKSRTTAALRALRELMVDAEKSSDFREDVPKDRGEQEDG